LIADRNDDDARTGCFGDVHQFRETRLAVECINDWQVRPAAGTCRWQVDVERVCGSVAGRFDVSLLGRTFHRRSGRSAAVAAAAQKGERKSKKDQRPGEEAHLYWYGKSSA
jgi:hypothetical protein